jgi:hypothetical protein
MRRFLRWLWRYFARPRPVRPRPAPAARRPSFEGLEERRMLAASLAAALPLPAAPAGHTFLARREPGPHHRERPLVVAGDFNGDGQTDLLAVRRADAGHDGSVRLLLSNGDGTFTGAPIRLAEPDAVRDSLAHAPRADRRFVHAWCHDRAAWRDEAERARADVGPAPDAMSAPPRPTPSARAVPDTAAPDRPAARHPGDDSAHNAADGASDSGSGPVPSGPGADPHAGEVFSENGGRSDVLTPAAVAAGEPEGGTEGPACGPASAPCVAAPGAAAVEDTDLASLVALGRASSGPDFGEQAPPPEPFWDLLRTDGVRRVLADAAALTGTSAALLPPGREPPGRRWAAASLGQLLAQAIYLGTLKTGGPGGGPGPAAAVLQPAGDTQLLLADLTQRLTEELTRLVHGFYLHFLGRAATAGEAGGWVGLLLGGQTEEQVLSAFLSTTEFYQRAGALVGSGTADERFVQGLYQLLLGRPAAEAELGGWLGALPTLGRGGVASALLGSTEYRGRQVGQHFQDLLGRPATPDEVASWANSPFDLKTIRMLLGTSQG